MWCYVTAEKQWFRWELLAWIGRLNLELSNGPNFTTEACEKDTGARAGQWDSASITITGFSGKGRQLPLFPGKGEGREFSPCSNSEEHLIFIAQGCLAFNFKTYRRISSCRFKSRVCGILLWQQVAMRSWRSDSKLTVIVRLSHHQHFASVATHRLHPTHSTDLRLKTYGAETHLHLQGENCIFTDHLVIWFLL